MAPTRNPSNPAPRAQVAPYQTRSRAINGAEPSNTSTKAKKSPLNDKGDDEDYGEGQDGYTIASGGREKCSKEQSDALEELFWSSKGFPTRSDKEEVAARVGKSYHSTNVWMQNRRHPRDETRKPWFLIAEAIDPEIDPNAPIYPLEGVVHKSLSKKGKKEKRVIAGGTSKGKTSIKVTENVARNHTSMSATAQPLNPPLAVVRMRDSMTPETSHSSGDSNGSAISTPRKSPPVVCPVVISPIRAPEGRTALSMDQAASILLGMKVGHGNPFGIDEYTCLQLAPLALPVSDRFPESSVRLRSQ